MRLVRAPRAHSHIQAPVRTGIAGSAAGTPASFQGSGFSQRVQDSSHEDPAMLSNGPRKGRFWSHESKDANDFILRAPYLASFVIRTL